MRALDPLSEGAVIWFTGLPSSGKSTLGEALAQRLRGVGFPVEHLDGDQVRAVFPSTGFSRTERDQHIRRIGFMASLLEKHGVWVIATFVSPYAESRRFSRAICRRFAEVYVATPLSVCELRDTKGLYARARRGEIAEFTGVSDPFEAPEGPEVVVDTSSLTVAEGIERVWRFLTGKRWLAGAEGQ